MAVRVLLLVTSLPLPMVFPWRWEHGVRLYLSRLVRHPCGSCSEVPGLPVSPGLFRFSRGALSSGFPIQWPPFRGWLSGSSVRCVGLASSTGHLASCFSLFARFRPAISLVFAALGWSMFGCSVALLPGVSAVSFASSCWRCSSGPPLLLGWRASLSRPGQRENNRMGERF